MATRVANPSLHWLAVKARDEELRRAGSSPSGARDRRSRRRLGRAARAAASLPPAPPVTIRHAYPDDSLLLLRLAAIDSAQPLLAPVLVAEVDGEVRAALSLRDGAVIADPFHRTQPLVELLLARVEHLASTDRAVRDTPGRALSRWILAARGLS
jgi:hypothetical protein